jgi:hypothetical protein
MIMNTVKTDRDTCFAIGKATWRWDGQLGVSVQLDGRQVTYALESKEVVGYRLVEGDPLLVKFHPEDQFATVVPINTVAEAFGYKVTEY